jgi:glycosyltransferase involved in cell wall biosynthesis
VFCNLKYEFYLRRFQEIENIKKSEVQKTQTEIDETSKQIVADESNIMLSVIVPVYQEESILERTLSIYSDEFKNEYSIELIVSDGGSTDRTVEIAKKYADKIALHKKDHRQSIAEGRNNGADIASGKCFVFINGDTIPEAPKDFFDHVHNWSIDENSKIDAFACRVGVFPEEELTKDRIFYNLHNNYVRFLNFIGIGMGRGECQIVKRHIFEKAGRYNNDIIAGEDFDLFRRISKIGKVKYEQRLKVLESPRRFRKLGYIRTLSNWLLNALSVMILGRSISKDWEAVR